MMNHPPLAGRRAWLGLAVLALPTLLVSIDVFVVLLALPRLSAELGANNIQQLWIVDIHGFLVTMGSTKVAEDSRKRVKVKSKVYQREEFCQQEMGDVGSNRLRAVRRHAPGQSPECDWLLPVC